MEARPRLGGVWTNLDGEGAGVAQATRTTSSRLYLHASDFEMPSDFDEGDVRGEFVTHREVASWLEAYVQRFGVAQHYRLGTRVESIREDGDGFEVTFSDDGGRRVERFDFVVCAVGQQQPVSPRSDAAFEGYAGEMFHSSELRTHAQLARFRGLSVAVVGGGESASDMAMELDEAGARVLLSMRSGAWIFDRVFGNGAFDVMAPRAVWWTGWYRSALIAAFSFTLQNMFGVGGHGVTAWAPGPGRPFMRSFFNKGRDVVHAVVRGRVGPRAAVMRCRDHFVWFAGREEPDVVDAIVFCTGYRADLRMLGARAPTSFAGLFRTMYDVENPRLAFVGTMRPIFGSFPALSELQARQVAAFFAGRIRLPHRDARLAAVAHAARQRARDTPYAASHGRDTLVSLFKAADDLAKPLSARPRLLHAYLFHPRLWWALVSGPWTPHQYLLNDPPRSKLAEQLVFARYPSHFWDYHVMSIGILIHIIFIHTLILFLIVIFVFLVT